MPVVASVDYPAKRIEEALTVLVDQECRAEALALVRRVLEILERGET